MRVELLSWLSLAAAAIPAALILTNLFLYRRAPNKGNGGSRQSPRISVLIPARNEEESIGGALASILTNEGMEFEVLVLDDHSRDRTAAIVSEFACRDRRVRLLTAKTLPSDWCGKQFACHQLAQRASFEWLLFLDADVRLSSNALREVVDLAMDNHLDLLSGVPRQETGSLLERLLIPLIHFVLLGFLPIRRMRRSGSESYAAGCGQLFLARRSAYQAVGGHASIKASLHDGLQLPRAFRRAGFQTDLFDATGAARCRMYRSSGETWRGLGKNAIEGLASPRLIVPATGMLLLGQVLPFVLVALSWCQGGPLNLIALIGLFCAMVSRSMLAIRFHQSCLGVLLHPLSVFILCLIQWDALWRFWKGQPSEWKGRSYPGLPAVLPPG